jgi:hypothetical protein
MKGFVAVLEREIFERRLLAVVALILGLVPLVLPLAPGLLPGGFSSEDLRSGLAIGITLALTTLLALGLGSTIIAGDLAERRLGFYFARPLSGAAIWAGKIAAALVVVLGCGALALVPAALVGIDSSPFGLQAGLGWTGFLVLCCASLLGLILAAHAASLIVRSRSPWLLLDLVALGTVAGLYWSASRRLTMAGVGALVPWGRDPLGDPREWIAAGFLLVVVVALALAGALQVVRGRTDLRRGHRFLSQTLWGVLLAAAFTLTGLSIWWAGGGPGDLRSVDEVIGAPSGGWVALVGSSSRIAALRQGFLYDLRSGRFVRAGFGTSTNDFVPEVRFSADGRRAVWVAYDQVPFQSPLVLFRLDLDRPGAAPVRTLISFPRLPVSLALSPDGRRVADYGYYAERRLTVADVDSGRVLAAAEYDPAVGQPHLAFADADHLRIYEASRFPMEGFPAEKRGAGPQIFELDLTSRTPRLAPVGALQATGAIPSLMPLPPGTLGMSSLNLSPAGDRILLHDRQHLNLCDARTGEVLKELAGRRSTGSFLADGRIAVATADAAAGRVLIVFSPDGRSELRRFLFPGAHSVVMADQPGADLLRVVVGAPKSPWEVRVLDLATGASRSLGARRLLSLGGQRPVSGSRLAQAQGFLWFDLLSFRERVVLKDS